MGSRERRALADNAIPYAHMYIDYAVCGPSAIVRHPDAANSPMQRAFCICVLAILHVAALNPVGSMPRGPVAMTLLTPVHVQDAVVPASLFEDASAWR